MRIKRLNKILWRVILAGAVLSPAALADVYDLTVDDCSSSGTGACGPQTSFGTVTVVQATDTHGNPITNEVDITVSLLNSNQFVSTGAGAALGFNISGAPPITIPTITTGFGYTSPTDNNNHLDGTGTFDYAVYCTGCGSGGSAPLAGPLSFTVSVGSGTLAPSDFVDSVDNKDKSTGYIFSVDILSGTTGKTGDVAAMGPSTSVTPEPGAVMLYGTGLIVFGGWLRRRNHRFTKSA